MLISFFSILFLLLLFYLSMMPIVLFIDTKTNQYYLQVKGLVKASIDSHEEELFRIRLQLFFLSFYFYPLRNIGIDSKKKILKSTENNNKKIGKGINFKKGLRMLKSFKVKRFLFDIDTGDCILNAKLYPLFAMLNYHVGGFSVNFEGRNRVELHIYSRPIYLIKSFINL